MKMNKKNLNFRQGDKIKYWNIELQENKYVISSGKHPDKLKSIEKIFTYDFEAKYAFTEEVRKKLKEGYFYKNENPTGEPGELLLHFKIPGRNSSQFFDLHPDGKMLIFSSLKNKALGVGIYEMNLETGTFSLLFSEESVNGSQTFIHSLQYNASGKQIFYLLNTEVKIFDIQSGRKKIFAGYKEFFNGPNPFCFQPQFDSGKRRFLFVDDGLIKIINESGETIFQTPWNRSSTAECRTACLSPSGKYLALYHASRFIIYNHKDAEQDTTNKIEIWEIDNNKIMNTIEVENFCLQKIKFNMPENEIAFTKTDADGPGFFDTASGKFLGFFTGESRPGPWLTCYDFDFSRDGKYLAADTGIYAASPEKKSIMQFEETNRNTYKLMFSPDSKLYLQGGNNGDIYVRKI